VQALSGEKRANMLGESDRKRKLQNVKHCSRRKVKRRSILKVFERQDEAFKGLLKRSMISRPVQRQAF
jgi:hypothetical protein